MIHADELGNKHLRRSFGRSVERRISSRCGKDDANPAGSLYDVGIRHNVSLRIENHTRADGVFLSQYGGSFSTVAALFVRRTEAGNLDLNHGAGNFRSQFGQRAI